MKLSASYSEFLVTFLVHRFLNTIDGFSSSAATRIKRILFVFSVMRVLDAEMGSNPATISDINGRLHLSHTDGACLASAAVSKRIWREAADLKLTDLPILSLATTTIERELVTSFFLRRCPRWLRYGSTDMSDMRRDINKLFKVIVTRDA